jgi:hypothetical protein
VVGLSRLVLLNSALADIAIALIVFHRHRVYTTPAYPESERTSYKMLSS